MRGYQAACLVGHEVVALRGEEARKAFFGRNDLAFMEGYSVLFGGTPDTKDIGKDKTERTDRELSLFLRHMASILKPENVAKLIPIMLSDLQCWMEGWGQAGTFNPFEVMYSIVFQMTVRAAAAREIADSVERCKQLEELYWKVERSNTAASLLFPWFPSIARIQKIAATIKIYNMLNNVIKSRQREGRREEDPLQKFIDGGYSTVDVIGFTMGVLFAGIVNTGTTCSWIFVFLDQVPEWQTKVIGEISAMLDKYAPRSEDPNSIAARFSMVPLQAWEDEMPILDACIKETLRLVLSRTALRRIISGDIQIEGRNIPNGTFLAYSMSETHMDASIYPNPTQYDPGRHFDGQGKAQTYSFLGWGAGRHPCAGRRFAQYTIKSMVAMFLTAYTYEVIDASGKKPDPSVTVPDKNDLYRASPIGQTFYLKYSKREKPL
ncbi:hypothetical protein OPQ81_001159 [Rhizoctonia solani]|nr:hypothetical protein OPQ81_001159 [Rhizoctonia solani]